MESDRQSCKRRDFPYLMEKYVVCDPVLWMMGPAPPEM
jgi:hypothetical protein